MRSGVASKPRSPPTPSSVAPPVPFMRFWQHFSLRELHCIFQGRNNSSENLLSDQLDKRRSSEFTVNNKRNTTRPNATVLEWKRRFNGSLKQQSGLDHYFKKFSLTTSNSYENWMNNINRCSLDLLVIDQKYETLQFESVNYDV